jgi:hypothetical protein
MSVPARIPSIPGINREGQQRVGLSHWQRAPEWSLFARRRRLEST